MTRTTRYMLTAMALCVSTTANAQTTINFDNLSDGNVVTNQYAGVLFSSSAGNVNYITSQSAYNASKPNFICTGPAGSGINCSADTFVDFIGAVSGVSIKGLGINDGGNVKVAQVDAWNGATFLGSINVLGNSEGYNPLTVDLSGFGAITRFGITNITDAAGIGWDDLTYTAGAVNVAPEPSTVLLFAAGLAGLVMVRRKRTR